MISLSIDDMRRLNPSIWTDLDLEVLNCGKSQHLTLFAEIFMSMQVCKLTVSVRHYIHASIPSTYEKLVMLA